MTARPNLEIDKVGLTRVKGALGDDLPFWKDSAQAIQGMVVVAGDHEIVQRLVRHLWSDDARPSIEALDARSLLSVVDNAGVVRCKG